MPSSTIAAEATSTTEHTATDELTRELAYRKNDGIQVALLWQPSENAVTILVEDSRTGVVVEFDVANEDAMDAFHHPFAYAP